tara:strand:- start:3234 stop:5663 length:2430 start_codon:yes stop_codon:yes gene_type:complete
MQRKLTLFLWLLAVVSYGQKSAPVAGHAAQLIDLLKKDYSTLEYSERKENILRDMNEVFLLINPYTSTKVTLTTIIPSHTNINIDKKDYPLFTKDNSSDIYWELEELMRDVENKKLKIKQLNNNLISTSNNTSHTKIYQELNNEEIKFNTIKLELEKTIYNNYLIQLYSLYLHFNETNVEDKNLYISQVISSFIIKFDNSFNYKTDTSAQSNYSSSIQKAIPFIGGDLEFSVLIDGLSRFLAKRIKDELTTHAIIKIQGYLKNPKCDSYLPELTVLLPTTTNYIKSFESNLVLNFVDDLKQYIEDDLNHLLANAVNLKYTSRIKDIIEKQPDLDFAFEAMELIPQISKLDHPIDYFDMLEGSRNIQRWGSMSDTPNDAEITKYNISNSIQLASLLAHSMIVVDNGIAKFASTSFMTDYSNDINFYYLYLGFLRQQNLKYYNINFYTKTSVSKPNAMSGELDAKFKNLINETLNPDSISTNKNKVKYMTDNISRISYSAEKLHDDFEAIKRTNNLEEEVSAEQIHSLLNQLIDFSEDLLVSVDDLLINLELKITNRYEHQDIVGLTNPYFTTARTVNEIFLDLHQKNFSTAIIKAIEIPDALRKNDPASVFHQENTTKLIHFINDIAISNDAEDVEAALNAFALPPGSSSIKENISSYYSVNSYPGLYTGFTAESINEGNTYSIGFTAPIGLYMQPWQNGKSLTLGFFIPLIDIASPVRLRLDDNDETEPLPDLEFKDIFSPGLYLSIGFKNTPLALNLGGQFGPSLKGFEEISNTDGSTSLSNDLLEKQVFFWSATLTLDIPLLNIYAR